MAAPNPPPGPAPVAQMYEDDVTMGDDDGTNKSKEDVEDDNFSLLSGDTSSETETSDDEPLEQVDWDAVGVEYILTKQALDALGERKPIPPPPSPPPDSARPLFYPPPSRIPFNGDKTFVQWIPYWSDPQWNDEYFTFDEDGKKMEQAAVHPLDKQRPALLPKDYLRRPTPYAQRFGIHAHQSDGRSRMSPTTSTTRHAQLSHIQDTLTGRKDYLTIEDADSLLHDRPSDMTSARYLRSLLAENKGITEHLEAYLRLHEMIEEDEAWQQVAFLNITTDERIAHGSHSLDSSPVQYDLKGDLHPLLERSRWMSPVTRGDSPENARLCYNLHGNRREWCAQNDHVWDVIQPALQLATRFLQTDHPYFVALLDAKSRRAIDVSRLLFGNASAAKTNWISFTADFDRTKGSTAADLERFGAEPIATIDKYGFDLTAAAADFLKQRLKLQFFSSNSMWQKGKPMDRVVWGLTESWGRNDPMGAGINISIGAEMVWPLLIPEFTHKEKASCTMMIAATVIHEMAHAANMALMSLIDLAYAEYHGPSSPLYGVPDGVLSALMDLGAVLTSKHEPFFEDEPMQEVGFACENAIFGGCVDSTFTNPGLMYQHYLLIPIALQLGAWPGPRALPHNEDETILLDPPLPIDQISALLPSDAYNKFFTQTFWKTEYKKYGIQALKLHPDSASLTVLERLFSRRKDLTRLFGKSHGSWLVAALYFLRKLGHGLLHAYCHELMHEKMEFVWVRKRFHHDCRVWAVRMKAFDKFLEEICEHMSELINVWERLNLSDVDKATNIEKQNQVYYQECVRDMRPMDNMVDWDTYHLQLHEELEHVFNALMASYKQLHHHLLHEIRCIQTLAVDYVQQRPLNKVKLYMHYVGQLSAKIEETFEPVIQDILNTLEQLRDGFRDASVLTEQADDDLQRMHNLLQMDLNHFAATNVLISEDNVFTNGLSWQEHLETIPRGRAKKKSQTMKRMATKELLKAPPVIRKLVETFLRIIDINKDEAKNEEQSRSYERLADKMKQDMKANPHRRQMANRYPGWLLPTPSPEPTTAYARPPGNPVPPWHTAPTPPPRSLGVLFGRPNTLASPTSPITPISTPGEPNFATQYASNQTPFPKAADGESVLSRRPSASPGSAVMDDAPGFDTGDADVGFGGGPSQAGWGPFGTPWSDSRTVSEELHAEGIRTPELRNVFGRED